MTFGNFELEEVRKCNDIQRKKLEHFLESQDLSLERDVEYSLVMIDDDEIIATASYAKNLLKCIAVKEEYQGQGLSEQLVSKVMSKVCLIGYEHIFLVTKLKNQRKFEGLGFGLLAQADEPFILMEYPKDAVKDYIEELQDQDQARSVGSIVMNCNPFTLGHLHLVEYAAKKCDVLHLFIVSEDASDFPTEARYQMVEQGIKHLNNIKLHLSGEYMISSATFPSYFLKQKSQVSRIHAEIDVDFFMRYIVPCLKINKRFVGAEPFCKVTNLYNQVIKEKLLSKGVEVEEIERIKVKGEYISASLVRELLKKGKIEEVKQLVPKTTYDFLNSKEGRKIIEKIKKGGEQ